MNKTASYSKEHTLSRCSSVETIFSIQGQETDYVRDTSDTEWCSDASVAVEYEPITEPEDETPKYLALNDSSSGQSDNEIIRTKVIEVSVGDDGELQLADSERTSSSSDSEVDLHDYGLCAHCRVRNNNTLYRYCEKCFKVRKSFFPPRPRRIPKRRRKSRIDIDSMSRLESIPAQPYSQDSGIETANSQEMKSSISALPSTSDLKRRSESADQYSKRIKIDFDNDSDSSRCSKDEQIHVQPLVKSVSNPEIVVEEPERKVTMNSGKEDSNMCIICTTEPKSGVFVHGRIAHICCCYKCAVKVWAKAKRCPVCNCRVSNVLKAVVM